MTADPQIWLANSVYPLYRPRLHRPLYGG